MVFHKMLTPAAGGQGLKMTKRRLRLTKIVLEQDNTAAAVFIRNEGDSRWFPLEFLTSEKKRTADINLTIDKGETVFFMCKPEPYFGRVVQRGDAPVGGQVVVHLYGNKDREDEEHATGSEPSAKRARTDAGGESSHQDFP